MIGKTVKYKLSQTDADNINHKRKEKHPGELVGNFVRAGDIVAGVVVREFEPQIHFNHFNLHLLLDGHDSHWVTSVQRGTGNHEWLEVE